MNKLLSGAKILNIYAIRRPPINIEKIILTEPIPVKIRIAAPIKIAITDVSPTEPGTNPIKELYKLYTPSEEN